MMRGRVAVCRNCGAEYEESLGKCPYCLTEKKIRPDQLDSYIPDYEEKSRKRGVGHKKRRTIVIAALGISLAIAGLATIGTVVNRGIIEPEYSWNTDSRIHNEKMDMDEALEYLEELYQDGDYETLYHEYLNLPDYSQEAEKYWEVASPYNWMDFMRETKEAMADPEGNGYYYGVQFALYGDSSAMLMIEDALADEDVKGNEEILEGFAQEIDEFLREDLELSDIEIKMIMDPEVHREDKYYKVLGEEVEKRLELPTYKSH